MIQRYTYTLACFAILFCTQLKAQTCEWANLKGGSNFDYIYSSSVSSIDGALYTAGLFHGVTTFTGASTYTLSSAGNSDVLICKYSKEGVVQWIKKEGKNSLDAAYSTALDRFDNLYVGGFYTGTVVFGGVQTYTSYGNTGDAFVAKYNKDGVFQWAKAIGGSGANDRVIGIGVLNDSLYISGYYGTGNVSTHKLGIDGDTVTSIDNHDIFLCKMDLSGNKIWLKSYGGYQSDVLQDMTIKNNHIYLTGRFNATILSTPTLTFGLTPPLYSTGGTDGFIAKLDLAGNGIWQNKYGGSQNDIVSAVAVDDNDNVYMGGYFAHVVNFGIATYTAPNPNNLNPRPRDIFYGKMNSSGTLQWLKTGTGNNEDLITDIGINERNDLYISGYFASTNLIINNTDTITNTDVGYNDGFLFKVSADSGKVESKMHMYAQNNQHLRTISVDQNGYCYGVGDHIGNDTLHFSTLHQKPAGNATTDVLAFKFAALKTTTDLSTYCAGAQLKAYVHNNSKLVSGNQYHIDLSDSNGDFTSATRLGSKSSMLAIDTVTVYLPKNLTTSTKYRIRAIASGTGTLGVNGDTITIHELPVVDAGLDVELSTTDSEEIIGAYPAASAAQSPYTYAWTPNTNITATNIANPTVSPELPTTYVLQVTDALGCANTDTVVVTPSYTFFIDLSANPDTNVLFVRIEYNNKSVEVPANKKYGIDYEYPESPDLDSIYLKYYYDGASEPYVIKLIVNPLKEVVSAKELVVIDELDVYTDLSSGLYTHSYGEIVLVDDFFDEMHVRTPLFPKLNENAATDYNWVYEESYGENGEVISSGKQFYDKLGRPCQVQSAYLANNKILAAQTIYDSYGRGAIQTMAAPIQSYNPALSTLDLREAQYTYRTNFIQNVQGSTYSYLDFDRDVYINNPAAVKKTTANTLGYYYSENNSAEPFIDVADLPYQRGIYAADPFGDLKISGGVDNMHKIGSGKESKAFTMVATSEELQTIYGATTSHWVEVTGSSHMGATQIAGTGDKQVAIKTVSVDADGKEYISYSHRGLSVAGAQGEADGCQQIEAHVPMYYEGTKSADIHLQGINRNSLVLVKPVFYESCPPLEICPCIEIAYEYEELFQLTDLVNNRVLVYETDYTFGSSGEVEFTSTFNANYPGTLFLRISFNENIRGTYSPICVEELPVAYADFNLDYSQWSKSYYDPAGHLRQSFQPTGIDCNLSDMTSVTPVVSAYDYSSEGYAIAANSPDENFVQKVYDKEGKLRFSQNYVQRLAGKFAYVAYDEHGRVVETGEYTTPPSAAGIYFTNYYGQSNFIPQSYHAATSTIIDELNGLDAAYCSDRTFTYYGELESNEELQTAGYSQYANYLPHYTYGSVAKTKNSNSETWYSYRYNGQAEYTVQRIADSDYAAQDNVIGNADKKFKTLDYSYNAQTGQLENSTFQKYDDDEKLIQRYYYNDALQLEEVKIETDIITTPLRVAKYYYYTHGMLKRKELGTNLQGIDYVYTAAGLLKSINSPSMDGTVDPGQDGVSGGAHSAFAPDVFGMAIDYYAADYSRSGTGIKNASASASGFSGRIDAIRYKINDLKTGIDHRSNKIAIGSASERDLFAAGAVNTELMTQYTYDKLGQLSTAVFGLYTNSVFNAKDDYKEYGNSNTLNGINYDKNGNITNLKRNAYNTGSTGATVQLIDDFTYTYTSGKNQLASILDNAGATALTTDFEAATTKNFSYNGIGQLTASEAEGVSEITYHPNGKIKQVTYTADSRVVEYSYGDGGQKIRTKHSYNDGSGAKTKYTWYAFGGLAVYEREALPSANEGDILLAETTINGGGQRLGVIKTTGANYEIQYELTDQVGNVRAVVSQGSISNVPKVDFWADYYVFGGLKPGRQYSAGSYRYEAGGLENAEGQANWGNFELRMLNKDLGRWMTPDPYGQFHSPYLAMGNNPVSNVDPDGGWVSIADLDPGHPFFYLLAIQKRYAGKEMTHEMIASYVNDMQQYNIRLQEWLYFQALEELRLLNVLIQNHPENFVGLNPNEESGVSSRMKELNTMIENSAKYLNAHAGKDKPPMTDEVSLSAWHAKTNGNYYNRKAEQREMGIGLWYFNAGSVIPYRSAEEAYEAALYMDAKERGVDEIDINFEYDINGNILGWEASWVEAATKITQATTYAAEKAEPTTQKVSISYVVDNNGGGGNEEGNFSVLESVQLGLDAVGWVPGPGEIADAINAGIYSYNGDYVNAAISMAGTVPFLGMAATGTRFAAKVLKPSISEMKSALNEVHSITGSLPKGNIGKFGSPQRGTSVKGYRLDPPHPGRPIGDPESYWHFNYWDYTGGKRGSGGVSGAIPIKP